MNIVRTIESFLPHVTGPARQAAAVSSRLEEQGISSPVVTSFMDVDPHLPAKESLGPVQVTRLPVRFRAMRYAFTPDIAKHLKHADLIHSHNYRNYQTDAAFFLPGNKASLLF